MKSWIIYFLCFTGFLFLASSMNMNFKFSNYVTTNAAYQLCGKPSLNFPGSSMINYILFGISDTIFEYYQFLLYYGFKVNNFISGDLIIGNDGKLGGICVDNEQVVIPVPNSNIQLIRKEQLQSFFPKGYTILRNNNDFDNTPYKGFIFGKVENRFSCNPCNISLLNYKISYKFYPETVIYLQQMKDERGLYIDLYGYIQEYDIKNLKGKINVAFNDRNIDSNQNFILDPANDNSISFYIDFYGDFIFEGNLIFMINKSTTFYNFTGLMHLFN